MENPIEFDAKEISSSFNQSVGDLTSFLRPDDQKVIDFRQLTSKLFKYLKNNSGVVGIKDLVTTSFDEEQIWTQIEQDNQAYLTTVGEDVSKLSIITPKKVHHVPVADDSEEEEDFEDENEEENDDEEEDDDEEDEEEGEGEDEDEDEDINLDDLEDDEIDETEGNDTNFGNLIGPASSDEDDDAEIDKLLGPRERAARKKNLSSFEQEQQLLKEKISQLEDDNLRAKPWKLIGEVTADKRPTNSLLEDHLQYDFVSQPAPIIDKDVAESLENLIKQRIKDGIWDDVERKVKPTEKPFEYKRRLILDQEQSKVGLGEIYEKDYLQKKSEEKAEEENETHKEIRKAMAAIFLQLDSLSSYHFTPKPPEPEIKIIKNLPTITAEEAIPVSVGEGTLLAPEEIKEKLKRPVKGDTEKDSTDRKHDRRVKKYRQKLIAARKAKKQPTESLIASQSVKKKESKIEKAKKIKQFSASQLKT